MGTLTDRGLRAMKPGEWCSDGGARGAGTLAARRGKGEHVLFYFRYTDSAGDRGAIPLGEWSGSGGPLSLKAARERADELSRRYLAGQRDLGDILRAEEAESRAQREAAQRLAVEKQVRDAASLGALLDAYVVQLRHKGKSSASAVASAIRRHVIEGNPVLAETPADDVSPEDLTELLAPLMAKGKTNEARKLRSYIQAAYAAGKRARRDPAAVPELRALRISRNPAGEVASVGHAMEMRARALSVAELSAYWRRIDAMPGPEGAMLRFHLLTGGQRVEQLGRLTIADFDREASTVSLEDAKGRRSTPRRHVLPLIRPALEALDVMTAPGLGPYLFTITGGETGAVYSTAQHRLSRVVSTMLEAGELPGGSFTMGDLRRTVETRLAEAGVSLEIRAQLQSHGLGGVQSRHYDRADYLVQKREALQLLARLIGASKPEGVMARALAANTAPRRGWVSRTQ